MCLQYSGVVNAKAVGIEAAKSGKGIVLTTKNSKKTPFSIKSTNNASTIKKGGSRRAAGVVSNVVAKKGYRADLTKGKFDIRPTLPTCISATHQPTAANPTTRRQKRGDRGERGWREDGQRRKTDTNASR